MLADFEMTRDMRSLILYFETRLVDNYGKCASIRMNETDFKNTELLKQLGLLEFERLLYHEIRDPSTKVADTHVVKFSDDLWKIAHQLRRERADKNHIGMRKERIKEEG